MCGRLLLVYGSALTDMWSISTTSSGLRWRSLRYHDNMWHDSRREHADCMLKKWDINQFDSGLNRASDMQYKLSVWKYLCYQFAILLAATEERSKRIKADKPSMITFWRVHGGKLLCVRSVLKNYLWGHLDSLKFCDWFYSTSAFVITRWSGPHTIWLRSSGVTARGKNLLRRRWTLKIAKSF